jgi:N-methylhydantoinase A
VGLRLGIDTGGTFTDLVALDEESGATRVMKVTTTPEDPAIGVLRALTDASEAFDFAAGDVSMLVEGSTIAINTLVQRNGARVGLLVTRGFRDVLELGRLRLPRVNDFYVTRPVPLVPRALVREVTERLDANGIPVEAPDPEEVLQHAGELRGLGVDAICIAFLHAFRNPAHEMEVATLVRAEHPDLFVTTSTEIWPVRGEYERTIVAVVNAYVGERMRDYVTALETGALERGIRSSMLATKSNGGVMDAAGASQRPVETLMSGPSAGVVAAYSTARAKGWERALSFDMGGTTADVAIIDGGIPYSYESAAGDFQIVVPSVDVQSIGAGGGSIVSRDEAGVLKVGPRSAGAAPGPACYGLGGVEATVTDAFVALGMIPDGAVLGGWVTVRRELAVAALERVGASAESVLDVATSTMSARLMPLAAAAGVDLGEVPLIAFGGAGPTQGCLLARALGVSTVLVPPMPGAMCALGALLADLRVDFVRTLSVPCDDRGVAALRETGATLERDAHEWLEGQRVSPTSTSLRFSAEMRFHGQSFEIVVPLPDGVDVGAESIHQAFCAKYASLYGHVDAGRRSEIVNLRVQLTGHLPHPRPRRVDNGTGPARVSADGLETYARADLDPGSEYKGPAIVVQYDTTIYLPEDSVAVVDELGNLEIRL